MGVHAFSFNTAKHIKLLLSLFSMQAYKILEMNPEENIGKIKLKRKFQADKQLNIEL